MARRNTRRWTAVALVGLSTIAGAARADAPRAPATVVEEALADLASPLQSRRQAAVEVLVGLLPGARARVIEALGRAGWSAQLELVDVLVQDGSDEALDAILGHMERAEATQAAIVRDRMLRDEALCERLLARWRTEPEAFLREAGEDVRARRRRADLVRLLERAEIEQLFLSRKSTTGATGYYKGQYEVLVQPERGPAWRTLVLEVVTGVALDQAMAMPDVYRFLRPHHVDESELRAMATNAMADLSTTQDTGVLVLIAQRIAELEERRAELHRKLQVVFGRGAQENARRDVVRGKPFQNALAAWEDCLGEYADIITCRYVILPDGDANALVRNFLDELRSAGYPYVPTYRWGYIAGVLIRVGWYHEAIKAYDLTMDYGGSKPLGYYNQACAYANWSQQPGLGIAAKRGHLVQAEKCIAKAVARGWSDIGWMEQDRDLDPIRGSATYRRQLEIIRERLRVPADDEK
jgi:hypothetical protein